MSYEPVNTRKLKDRDQALGYIEEIAKHFDIELNEDFLANAIEVMQKKHDDEKRELVLRTIGSVMVATGTSKLVLDDLEMSDSRIELDIRYGKGRTTFELKM